MDAGHNATMSTEANSSRSSTSLSIYKPFGFLRFFLALLVAESHAYFLAGIEGFPNPIQMSLGTIAVMIFFVLSGFVITEALNVFYKRRLGGFLLNRFLRLLPPYCAALATTIVLHYLLHLSGLMPAEMAGTQPVQRGGQEAVIVAISIPTTEIFYLRNIIANILVMPIIYGVGLIGMFPSYAFVPPYWALNVEIQYYLIAGSIWWGIYDSIPPMCGRWYSLDLWPRAGRMSRWGGSVSSRSYRQAVRFCMWLR